MEFDLRTDTESFAAIQALVEGDAIPVTNRYIAHLDHEHQRRYEDAVEDGVLGELVLLEIVASRGLDDDTVRDAAEGWGGDAYVVWRDGGDLRASVNIEMDTEADTVGLEKALLASTDSGDAAPASVVRTGALVRAELIVAGAT
ncbi:MAG: hypothetical protein H0V95_01620 [Actinobacteria bacterium]|nr:hypothetical protein [Actinomycetota bacterium]